MSQISSTSIEREVNRGLKRKIDGDEDSSTLTRGDGYARKRYRLRSVQRARRERAQLRQQWLSVSSQSQDPVPTNSLDKSNGPPYTPDPKFYFDDGDIYSVVDGFMCRVHCATLASAGGLLDTLFGGAGLIEPSKEEMRYDLPHFHVPMEITVRQWRFLLAFLYEKIVLSEKLPDGKYTLYWEAAVVLLELSDKLDSLRVLKAAFGALAPLFTGEALKSKPVIVGFREQEDRDNFYRIFPIQAILLFRRYNLPFLLPIAYYHAAQMPGQDLINGVQHGGQLLKVDPIAIEAIIRGKEELRSARRKELFSWVKEAVDDTYSHECVQCNDFLSTLKRYFDKEGYLDKYSTGLEGLSDEMLEFLKYNTCLRRGCREIVMQRINMSWRVYFRNLPEKFGLDPWKVIWEKQESMHQAWHGNYS